ncbi:hypothetical protein E2C01_056620 [Portunus trituberculatus]|uniref:Uncharacterized protein n=1 Tax=Portunus trituberculatus TaxID=210409 RepID=A0A5B7H126_PORTR|nr:hypothetical protein [Portunus trituberculatus]
MFALWISMYCGSGLVRGGGASDPQFPVRLSEVWVSGRWCCSGVDLSTKMPCSAITLSLATICAVVSVALLAIAFGTDNWQYINVNRIAIEA